MDGGNAQLSKKYFALGGGAGGIIQIIAPEGSLAAHTLSMKFGFVSRCFVNASNGHFLLKGNYSYIKTKSPGI